MVKLDSTKKTLALTLAAVLWIGFAPGCGDAPAGESCEGADCALEPDAGSGDDAGSDSDADRRDDSDVDDGNDVPEPEVICLAVEETVCANEVAYQVCNAAGTAFDEPVACLAFQQCVDGACVNPEPCRPGPVGCFDDNTVLHCEGDGFTRTQQACETGNVCYDGRCVDEACDPNLKTYIGCDFWAVHLDNLASERPTVVTVSNANDEDVVVTLLDIAKRTVYEEVVRAERVRSFSLHDIALDDTSLTSNSYRIQSTLPITVHQFNPRNNSTEVFSNDASLLLPAVAVGQEYLVLGWPTEESTDRNGHLLKSFATVVGLTDETTLTIATPTAVQSGEGFEGIPAGEERVVTLNRGEVLSMTTEGEHGADLTGMSIVASAPVAVFAGSECANIPLRTRYCDHIEQQLTPVAAWGREYLGTKFRPRGTEPDVWRVLSASDGNILTTVPALSGVDGVTLDRGQILEFATTEDFALYGTSPIAVGQFMVGSAYPGRFNGCVRGSDESTCAIPSEPTCKGLSGIGDPAFLQTVPNVQFRNEYLVLTPGQYFEDYFTMVFEAGTELTLDGQPVDVSAADAIADTPWRVLRLAVEPGSHEVQGSVPFGLYAYGYDCDVSYAYPGGLDLQQF